MLDITTFLCYYCKKHIKNKNITEMETSFEIIQGGMGVGISRWYLARTVSMLGGLGTVSGVILERVFAHELQKGDPGGHLRRALAHFPFPGFAEKVLKEYFVEGGIKHGTPYKMVPLFTVNPSELLISLTICANFSFVWLAKEGHADPVSINYLTKVDMPLIYAITGAMIAGVDYISMGAGLPLQIPKVINAIAEWETATYDIKIDGKNIKKYTMSFDPKSFLGTKPLSLSKPSFLPIISSNLLADLLIKEIGKGNIYGFIVETDRAGGHYASKKRKMDFAQLAKLGIPFWIGGGTASPEMLKWARSVGASGIQVGSIFALCEESGMNSEIRKKIRQLGFEDKLIIRGDERISPSGYSFKVVEMEGTLSQRSVYESRVRICNHGGFFIPFERSDGLIGYRCPAEPINVFKLKFGDIKDTVGRACFCNGLLVTCALGNPGEPPIITLGNDFSFLKKLMKHRDDTYIAEDAMKYLTAVV